METISPSFTAMEISWRIWSRWYPAVTLARVSTGSAPPEVGLDDTGILRDLVGPAGGQYFPRWRTRTESDSRITAMMCSTKTRVTPHPFAGVRAARAPEPASAGTRPASTSSRSSTGPQGVRPSELESLEVAGQALGGRVAPRAKADGLDDRRGIVTRCAGSQYRRARRWRRCPARSSSRTAHELEGANHPARAMACGGFPVTPRLEEGPAGVGRDRPRDEVEHRGLASTVGPDDAEDAPSSTSKHVVDRRHATEPLGEALDPKDAHERNHLSRMAL